MVWLDYAFLVIIALSAVISIFRGFAREVLSLVGWLLASWVALRFSADLGGLFEGYIVNAQLRIGVALVSIFVLALIICMVINHFIVKLIRLGGMGGLDRIVGSAFGILRGLVIVTILVMFAGFTPLSSEPVWTQSPMVGYFQSAAEWVKDYFPDDMVNRIQNRISLKAIEP